MEIDSSVTLFNIFGWLHTNRKRVLAGAIVIALIAAIVTFYTLHKNQVEASANEQLLAQPLGINPAEPANPQALLAINEQYASTSAGADAGLLAAKAFFLQGKYDQANQTFAKFIADNPGNPLIPRAEVGIAASLESAGKISEAVTKYKEVAAIYSAQADITFPVKLTLGRLSEAQGKPDAAVSYYTELARINNPYDPWVAEARERLRLILAKHPELDKSGVNPYQTPSAMTPSAAEVQLSAPPATQTAPAPAAPATSPQTNQDSLPFPAMGAPPPGANPGATPK